jgi:hypothetical protein
MSKKSKMANIELKIFQEPGRKESSSNLNRQAPVKKG